MEVIRVKVTLSTVSASSKVAAFHTNNYKQPNRATLDLGPLHSPPLDQSRGPQ